MPFPTTTRPVRRSGTIACALGLLAAVPTPGAGQLPLRGHVLDRASGRAIEGVQILLLDSVGVTLGTRITDPQGAFAFVVAVPAPVRIRAARIGYRTALTPVLRPGMGTADLEIRMDAEAVQLPSIDVTTPPRAPSPFLAGFERRRKRGLGRYFTREDIERHQPTFITDLLATVPGVHLLSSGNGARRLVMMSRARGRDCVAQVYVDGFHINSRIAGNAFRIDELVRPDGVEGIEVYRGLSTVPAEFLSPAAVCGVIVIWTRRGI